MTSLLVSRDPEIMSGALCFTGTRVPAIHLPMTVSRLSN